LTALALAAYGAHDCYESCRYDLAPPAWQPDESAWQWNALSWLGLCCGVASITFVVTAWRFRPGAAAIALVANLAFATVGGLLVRASGQAKALNVALVLLGLAALGAGLIVTRRKARARY
jgi:hypothetical protein